MKYFIIGYMGSGKSTLGKALAERKGIAFYDLDAYIEKVEGQTITDIFQSKGEIYFRNLEHRTLKQLLDKEEDFVLSLGGGTPCYAGNMELLTNNGVSIYLQYPLEVLVNRLWEEKAQRPLIATIATKELLEDFIRKHLFERAAYYMQATYSVKLTQETPEQVVQAVRKLLQ